MGTKVFYTETQQWRSIILFLGIVLLLESNMGTYHVSSLEVPNGLYPTITMSCCLQNSKSLGWVK